MANYYEAFELGSPKLARFVALRVLDGWSLKDVHIWSAKLQLSENLNDFWCLDGEDGECYDESSKHFWRDSCMADPANVLLAASNASAVFGTGNCAGVGLSEQAKEMVAQGIYRRMPGRSVPQQMLIDKQPVERLQDEPEDTFLERCQAVCDEQASKVGSCGGFVEDKELRRAEPLCRLIYNETIDGSQLKLSSVKLVGVPHHTLWIRKGEANATTPAHNFGWCAEQACGALVAGQLENEAPSVKGSVEWTQQQCDSAVRQRSIHCTGERDSMRGWCAAEWCGAQTSLHEVVPGASWGSMTDPAVQYLWTDTYFCGNRTRQQTLRCAETPSTERSPLSRFRAPINGTLVPVKGRIEPMGGRVHEQVADAAACASLCIDTGMTSLSGSTTQLTPTVPATEPPTAAPDLGDSAAPHSTALVTGATCESFDYSPSLEQCKLFSTSLLTGSTWGGPRGQWEHYEARSSLRDLFTAPQLGVLAGSDHGQPFKQIGSPLDCAAMCESEGSKCRSFVYSGPARECQLKFGTVGSTGLVPQSGFLYYEKQGLKQQPFGWIKSRVQQGRQVWSGSPEEVLVGPIPEELLDLELLGPARSSQKSEFLELTSAAKLWLALDSHTTVQLTDEWIPTQLQLQTADTVFNVWSRKAESDATVPVPYMAQQGEEWSGFVMLGPPGVAVSLLEPRTTVAAIDTNQLMSSDREVRFAPVPPQYVGLTQLLGPWYMETAMSFFVRSPSTVYVATPAGLPSGLLASDGWQRDEGVLADASKTARFHVDRKVFARGMVNIPMSLQKHLVRPDKGRPTIVFVGSADRRGVLEDSLPKSYRVTEMQPGVRVIARSGVRVAPDGLPLHLQGLLVLESPTAEMTRPLSFVLDSKSNVWVATRKGKPTLLSPDWIISAGVLIKMDDGAKYEVYRKQFDRGPATIPVEFDPKDEATTGRQGFVMVGDPTPLKCTVDGGGGNAGTGAQCSFPFSFNGNVYSDCVDGPPGAWCSTTAQYAGQWGLCGACESTFGGFRISTPLNTTHQLCIAMHHSNDAIDNSKAAVPLFDPWIVHTDGNSVSPQSLLQVSERSEPSADAHLVSPEWDREESSEEADQRRKRAAEAAASRLVFNPTNGQVCDDANPSSGKTKSAAQIVSDADCARQCGLRLTPSECRAYSFSPAVPDQEKPALCWLYSRCELVDAPDEHPAATTKLRHYQPQQPLNVPPAVDGSLIVQPCDLQQAAQYWTLDVQGLLRPASIKHKHMFASVAAPQEKSMARSAGLGLILRACEDGCRNEQTSQLEITEEGLLRSISNREYVIVTAQAAVEHSQGNVSALEPEPPVVMQKCSSIGIAGPRLCPWASVWKVEMPLSPAELLAKRKQQQKEAALRKVQLNIDLAKEALNESKEQGREVGLKANQMQLDLSRENSTRIANGEQLRVDTAAERDQEQLLAQAEKSLREAQAHAQLLPGQIETALKESQDSISSHEEALQALNSAQTKKDQVQLKLHNQQKKYKAAEKIQDRIGLAIKSINRLTQDSTATQIRLQKEDFEKKAKDAINQASDAADKAKASLAETPAMMEKGTNEPLQASKQEQRVELAAAAVASKGELNLASIAAAEKVLGDEKSVLRQLEEEHNSKRAREQSQEKQKQHDVKAADDATRITKKKLKEKESEMQGDKDKLSSLGAEAKDQKQKMVDEKQHLLTMKDDHDVAKEGILPAKSRQSNADTSLAVAEKELADATKRLSDAQLEYNKIDVAEKSKIKQANEALEHAKAARDKAQAKLDKAQQAATQLGAAQDDAVQRKQQALTQLTDSKVALETVNTELEQSETQLNNAALQVQRAIQKQSEAQGWKSQLDTWVNQATQQLSAVDVHTSKAAAAKQNLAEEDAERRVTQAGLAVKTAERTLGDAEAGALKAASLAAAATEKESAPKEKLAEDKLKLAKDDASVAQEESAVLDAKKDVSVSESSEDSMKAAENQAANFAKEETAKAEQMGSASDKTSAAVEAIDNKLQVAIGASNQAESEYKAAVAAFKEAQQREHGQKKRLLDAKNTLLDAKKQMDNKCAASHVHPVLPTVPAAASTSTLMATAAQKEAAAANKQKAAAEALKMQAAGEASAAKMKLTAENDDLQRRQMEAEAQKEQVRKQKAALAASSTEVERAKLQMQLQEQEAGRLEVDRRVAQSAAASLKQQADSDSKDAEMAAQRESSTNEVASAATSALARAQAKKAKLDARVQQYQQELQSRQRQYQTVYQTAIKDLERVHSQKMIRHAQRERDALVTQAKEAERAKEEEANADDVSKQSRTATRLSQALDYRIGQMNRQTKRRTTEHYTGSSKFAEQMEARAEHVASTLLKKQEQRSRELKAETQKLTDKLTKGAQTASEDMVNAVENTKPVEAKAAPTLQEARGAVHQTESVVRQQLIQGLRMPVGATVALLQEQVGSNQPWHAADVYVVGNTEPDTMSLSRMAKAVPKVSHASAAVDEANKDLQRAVDERHKAERVIAALQKRAAEAEGAHAKAADTSAEDAMSKKLNDEEQQAVEEMDATVTRETAVRAGIQTDRAAVRAAKQQQQAAGGREEAAEAQASAAAQAVHRSENALVGTQNQLKETMQKEATAAAAAGLAEVQSDKAEVQESLADTSATVQEAQAQEHELLQQSTLDDEKDAKKDCEQASGALNHAQVKQHSAQGSLQRAEASTSVAQQRQAELKTKVLIAQKKVLQLSQAKKQLVSDEIVVHAAATSSAAKASSAQQVQSDKSKLLGLANEGVQELKQQLANATAQEQTQLMRKKLAVNALENNKQLLERADAVAKESASKVAKLQVKEGEAVRVLQTNVESDTEATQELVTQQARTKQVIEIAAMAKDAQSIAQNKLASLQAKQQDATSKLDAANAALQSARAAEATAKGRVQTSREAIANAQRQVSKQTRDLAEADRDEQSAEQSRRTAEDSVMRLEQKVGAVVEEVKAAREDAANLDLQRESLIAPLGQSVSNAQGEKDTKSQDVSAAKSEKAAASDAVEDSMAQEVAAREAVQKADAQVLQTEHKQTEVARQVTELEASLMQQNASLASVRAELATEETNMRAAVGALKELQERHAAAQQSRSKDEQALEARVLAASQKVNAALTLKQKVQAAKRRISELQREASALVQQTTSSTETLHDFNADQVAAVEQTVAYDSSAVAEEPKVTELNNKAVQTDSAVRDQASDAEQLQTEAARDTADEAARVSELSEEEAKEVAVTNEASKMVHQAAATKDAAANKINKLEAEQQELAQSVYDKEETVGQIKQELQSKQLQTVESNDAYTVSELEVQDLQRRSNALNAQLKHIHEESEARSENLEKARVDGERASKLIRAHFAKPKAPLSLHSN
jgi:hypothetical protein